MDKAKRQMDQIAKTNQQFQEMLQLQKSMNEGGGANVFGQGGDPILNQLPGGSSLQGPALPFSLLESRTEVKKYLPVLDTDKPLPPEVQGTLWSWGMMRHATYGDSISTSQGERRVSANRGLAMSEMSFAMSFVQSIPSLIQTNEYRAAWQVSEESKAASMRAEAQLKAALAGPDKKASCADLINAQQRAIESYMQYVSERLAVANSDLEAADVTKISHINQLWKESQIYDQVYSQAVQDNFKEVPPLMTAAEAAKVLPSDAIYVSFSSSMALDNGYVLLLDPRKNREKPEILVEQMSIPLALVLRFDRMVHSQKSDLATFLETGRRLFDRLFPRQVGERTRGASRVILTPPSILWSFPFSALVISESNGPARHFGLEKSISYTDSANQLQRCRSRSKDSKSSLTDVLIVGGIPYNRPGQRQIFDRFRATDLPELEEAKTEAEEVAAVYGTKITPGEAASESLVRSRLEQASIVHIATHGYAGNTMPSWDSMSPEAVRSSILAGTPGIWLDVQESGTQPGFSSDGLLQAWEVKSQLNLKTADLVVLSACDVGQAKSMLTYGPELPLAFLRTGASTVVAAQAAVDDRATAKLMPQFHKLIKLGMNKDDALRQAMAGLYARSEFQHPAYWASFILLGDPDNTLFAKK